MKSVYLVSLGCDKNRVDGEVMLGLLREDGFSIVVEPTDADAIIINTCGFIQDAVQESINLVLELATHKQQGRCNGLIVVGCMAQRYRKEIQAEIPEADAILGTSEYDTIATVVRDVLGCEPSSIQKDNPLPRLAGRIDALDNHIAYVKIAEGCDNHCTYCTIPAIRGSYRSRPFEQIIEECRKLTEAGARELVLVAQDTARYGVDLYTKPRLHELLAEIAQLPDLTWVRLMYAYPEHITPELVQALNIPKVCKYIDMPIQHSEDSVLNRMGCSSTRKEILKLISRLRKYVPGIILRTTLMVGFPGESVEDFRGLYNFAKKVRFDRMGVFPYSREEGTPAATMDKQVKEQVKHIRRDRLMRLQQKIHLAKQQKNKEKIIPVMVDGLLEEINYVGRTEGDAHEVDAVVYFTSSVKLAPGEVHLVQITDADEYDLRGVFHEPAK